MKVILTLGAAVWDTGPSPTMQRRCAQALKIWETDKTQVMVPCGGLGQHPPTEAAAMAQIFQASGVPLAQIMLEDRSTTTFENIAFAQTLISAHDVSGVTIVTDSYHCPRAWLVARHFGLRPKMCSPSLKDTHKPTQIKQHLREAAAVPLYAAKLLRRRLQGSDKR